MINYRSMTSAATERWACKVRVKRVRQDFCKKVQPALKDESALTREEGT